MRIFMILCWLMIPVLAWAYHMGPGQEQVRLDQTQGLLEEAKLAMEDESFDLARMSYSEALAKLPAEKKFEGYAIRLGLAKAQTEVAMLPEARAALETLLTDVEADEAADEGLVKQVRSALANSQYHMTWLMRLEGLPAEDWEPEVEAARQHYRLLAEQAEASGDVAELEKSRQDLEATIRLARMDLSELQGLKIPKQCNGCCSNQCKKPSQKPAKKKGKKPGSGANMGPLPDGSGS
jgi:hypothetical protein